MSVESSTNLPLANVLSAPTCRRYDEAPLDAFHDKVKVVDWFVKPLAGALRTGASGGDTTTCVTCETHEDWQPVDVLVTTTVFAPD